MGKGENELRIEKLAKRKLSYIISRYGDDNGERLKPYYLEDIKAMIREGEAI